MRRSLALMLCSIPLLIASYASANELSRTPLPAPDLPMTIDDADDVADQVGAQPAAIFDVSDVDVDVGAQPADLVVDVSPPCYVLRMGNWHVSIQGLGAHGPNASGIAQAHDVEAIVKTCVDALRSSGHIVKVATVAAGGGESNLLQPRNGEDLYNVYVSTAGGKNFQGNPCPSWTDLPADIRRNWDSVAHAAQYPRAT